MKRQDEGGAGSVGMIISILQIYNLSGMYLLQKMEGHRLLGGPFKPGQAWTHGKAHM